MCCWHSYQAASGGMAVDGLSVYESVGVLIRGKGAMDALLAQLPIHIRWDNCENFVWF